MNQTLSLCVNKDVVSAHISGEYGSLLELAGQQKLGSSTPLYFKLKKQITVWERNKAIYNRQDLQNLSLQSGTPMIVSPTIISLTAWDFDAL